jgi:hypothetical protein
VHDLARKKVALDDERRKMAHATLRLEQERRQLEVSRASYRLIVLLDPEPIRISR